MTQRLDGLNALRKTYIDTSAEMLAGIDRLIADEVARSLPPTGKTLSVPWVSQLGPTAAFAPGDCGPACLASWLQFLGRGAVTVDQVSRWVGLAAGYNYTMPAHLIRSARHWGVDLYWKRYLSLDDIRAEIDAGQPAIMLGHYGALPPHLKFDPRYQAGHWFLIIGYTADEFIYLDPYWTERGQKTITAQALYHVWDSNYLDGNSNRQALRMRRE